MEKTWKNVKIKKKKKRGKYQNLSNHIGGKTTLVGGETTPIAQLTSVSKTIAPEIDKFVGV